MRLKVFNVFFSYTNHESTDVGIMFMLFLRLKTETWWRKIDYGMLFKK